MTDLTFEQHLKDWLRFSSTLQEQVKAECARNPEHLAQAMLKELLALHPFLQQIFLLRQGRTSDSPLHQEAALLSDMRYHTTPAKLLDEFEAAMAYFWAMATCEHAEKVIAENPSSSAAIVQQKHKAKAIADMARFDGEPPSLRKELVRQYRQDVSYLTSHYFDRKTVENDWQDAIQRQLIDNFWAPCGPDAKYRAGYALALAGQSDQHLPKPFTCLGFMGPSWEEGGITFALERRCFASSNPLLYYKDDAIWRPDTWALALRLSSGLDDVRREDSLFTFRFNPARHRRIFVNREDILLTESLGSALFVRCGSRDFHAECGEIIDGKQIPLARFDI